MNDCLFKANHLLYITQFKLSKRLHLRAWWNLILTSAIFTWVGGTATYITND